MEAVRLPSGAVVELERPRIAAVLLSGGSAEALVEAVWAHDMDPELLDLGDRQYIGEWCVTALSYDEDAVQLAAVCKAFGGAPSERLRIDDPVLALHCDAEFALALMEAKTGA